MKPVFIVGVIGIVLCILFFQTNGVQSVFNRKTATLAVIDNNVPLVLYIDNKLAGALPLGSQSILPGVHSFTLKNIENESGTDIFWQGELEVNEEDKVVMTLITSDASKLDGVVMTRFYEQPNVRGYSTVFMEQEGAVYVNGQKHTDSPVIVDNEGLTEVSIRTEHNVYPDIEVSFSKDIGISFATHIYTLYDYSQNIRDISGEVLPEGTIRSLHRRSEWHDQETPLPAEDFIEASWTNVNVFTLTVPEPEITSKLLDKIEDRFAAIGSSTRIPFCFIVDKNNEVWEGFGVWDYDFTNALRGYGSVKRGDCPVLYLTDEVAGEIPTAVFSNIATLIQSEPGHDAIIRVNYEDYELSAQEQFTVEVNVKNTGLRTWHMNNGDDIAIRSRSNEISDLYDQDNWISPQVVNRATESIVIPGGEITITLPLAAPIYTTKGTEKFILTIQGEEIGGADIFIPYSVNGVGSAVRVVQPPNGFLNVYESDSENTQLLTSLFENERYAMLQEKGDWAQIRLKDGRDGWVRRQYIQSL